ncbi:MAG: adenylate/guanylate cyclase domain-containing protein [Vicinamibacteria bacterium]
MSFRLIAPFALFISVVLLLLLTLYFRRSRRNASHLRERLADTSLELERLQRSFSRFAPEEVVDRIATSGMPSSGEQKEVTVLFSDLIGFTAMSGRLDPALVVRILNGYFRRMSAAIREHRGHVSKFIGDGILAFFGALEPNPWQSDDAVYAALAMRAELDKYNAELAAEGLPVLAHGIGLHRGIAVAGLMGSDDLMEFTVMGSNVNLASRVESLTRAHGVDILITQQVKEKLNPNVLLRGMPDVAIKGIAETVITYAVEGHRP